MKRYHVKINLGITVSGKDKDEATNDLVKFIKQAVQLHSEITEKIKDKQLVAGSAKITKVEELPF